MRRFVVKHSLWVNTFGVESDVHGRHYSIKVRTTDGSGPKEKDWLEMEQDLLDAIKAAVSSQL